ncbi:glycosyltransferase 61 family protein (plasmid) [Enterobacter hormaechei]|uniref:Glycosyltransferase 61 family protein n=1 Tax=Enterobacter hormaechei TaxID=158836 RepID=A0AAX3Z9N7_9ENTR|nr:glycosyltransferase 61 family protein [Enterobacter hormaechei]WMB13905.1 glycosyltransferase 61 family protein [Enterobacter hormaechei]
MIDSDLILKEIDYDHFFEFRYKKSGINKSLIIPEVSGSITSPEKKIDIPLYDEYIVEATDVVCTPRQLLTKDYFILPDTFRRRQSRFPHVNLDCVSENEFKTLVSTDYVEVIDAPCFYFDGEHGSHFGHFLLEVMSRLWCYKSIDIKNLIFITSIKPSPYHEVILAPFGISISQVKYFDKPVLCRKLLISSQGYVLEHSVSDLAHSVWDKIGAYYDDGDTSERVYVSRSIWSKQRNLINEKDIEKIFLDEGFTIVHPEKMSPIEQIKLFRSAVNIAGPSGSGFYNAIYSNKIGKRLILVSKDFITRNDALVNSRCNSVVKYVAGVKLDDNKSGMLGDWIIESQDVRDALRKVRTSS